MHELSWAELRPSICRTCVDGDGEGRCRLPVDWTCAVREQFTTLRRAIATLGPSAAAEPAVRRIVCPACGLLDKEGNCWKRDRLECALDRDLPHLIALIERSSSVSA